MNIDFTLSVSLYLYLWFFSSSNLLLLSIHFKKLVIGLTLKYLGLFMLNVCQIMIFKMKNVFLYFFKPVFVVVVLIFTAFVISIGLLMKKILFSKHYVKRTETLQWYVAQNKIFAVILYSKKGIDDTPYNSLRRNSCHVEAFGVAEHISFGISLLASNFTVATTVFV